MLIDPRSERLPPQLSASVVVIGAGPAGITLALLLAAAGVDVLVVESGSTWLHDPDVEGLTEAEVEPVAPYPLDTARARMLGGTSVYWTGHCHPLVEDDLAARPWVPDSGWPIGVEDLADGYAVAQRLLEVGPEPFDLEHWAPILRAADILPLETDRLTTSVFRLSPPTRFGDRYRAALADAPLIRVLLRTSVLGLDQRDGGGAVDRVVVTTPTGELLAVTGDVVVLAPGGLEVPRLLLHSGIGNDHDNVGRYFMEHPHVNVATGAFTAAFEEAVSVLPYGLALLVAERRILLSLTLRPQIVEQEQLLRSTFGFADPTASTDAGAAASVAALAGDVARSSAGGTKGLFLRGEQRPRRENRVTLDPRAVDRFGVPRLRLHWEVTPEDRADHLRALDLVARDLGVTGYGRVRRRDDADGSLFVSGGHHHMGGARMSDDPRDGVVDPTLRVHGQANLYVASGAVFPTSGSANPTLTIVALAARLADHLVRTA